MFRRSVLVLILLTTVGIGDAENRSLLSGSLDLSKPIGQLASTYTAVFEKTHGKVSVGDNVLANLLPKAGVQRHFSAPARAASHEDASYQKQAQSIVRHVARFMESINLQLRRLAQNLNRSSGEAASSDRHVPTQNRLAP